MVVCCGSKKVCLHIQALATARPHAGRPPEEGATSDNEAAREAMHESDRTGTSMSVAGWLKERGRYQYGQDIGATALSTIIRVEPSSI
jgi:hypothetical protein